MNNMLELHLFACLCVCVGWVVVVSMREILEHATSHHVVLCFVILRSMCVSEREIEAKIIGVCVCWC